MKDRIAKAFRMAALTLAAIASPAALAASLTEDEALRLALARPELADLDRARIGEAEADAIEAGLWSNPSLEYSRDETGATRETQWQLSQPLDFSGRRRLRRKAANLRIDAAEAGNQTRRGERAAEVRRAFHQTLLQRETLRVVDAWAGRFAVIGGVVDKLARAGEASGYDRRRLERERQAAEARLAEAKAGLERSRARLAALTGQEDGAEPDGRLLPDAPPDPAVLLGLLAQRPDLAALSVQALAADADNAASRRQFPEISLGIGGKEVEDGASRQSGTLLSLSMPLPLFDRRQGDQRRSAARAMAARAEHALALQQTEGELLGLHRQSTQLIQAAGRYRREAVAPSADLLRIAEAAYRAGESNILELLDAYKGAMEAEITALDLEWKARDACIELDQLTGNHPQ